MLPPLGRGTSDSVGAGVGGGQFGAGRCLNSPSLQRSHASRAAEQAPKQISKSFLSSRVVQVRRYEAQSEGLNSGGGGDAGTSEHQFGFCGNGVGTVVRCCAIAGTADIAKPRAPASPDVTPARSNFLAISARALVERQAADIRDLLSIESPTRKRLPKTSWLSGKQK